MNPNPEQQAVVDLREGRVVLTAGPGSGKTATLIARYRALVESGVSAQEHSMRDIHQGSGQQKWSAALARGNFKDIPLLRLLCPVRRKR